MQGVGGVDYPRPDPRRREVEEAGRWGRAPARTRWGRAQGPRARRLAKPGRRRCSRGGGSVGGGVDDEGGEVRRSTSVGEGRREAAPGDDRGIGPDPIWIGGEGETRE